MTKPKKIYFVGIKGVGMTSLAIMAKEAGFLVAGSDREEVFLTDRMLDRAGINYYPGFDKENVIHFVGPNNPAEVLVVTTGAHGGFDNPEVQYAKQSLIPVLTHGQAVGAFMRGEVIGKKNLQGVSVAGSHGKTTITAMLATYLSLAGLDPSYTVGTSELFPLGFSGHFGKGTHFIAEADEYVSEPKHDLRAKILYQYPTSAIVNNIDFDHPDVYQSIDEVIDVYVEFVKNMPDGGVLYVNGDSQTAQTFLEKIYTQGHAIPNYSQAIGDGKISVTTYGRKPSNDFYIANFSQSEGLSHFDIESKHVQVGRFSLSVPGIHNATNVLPAVMYMIDIGIPPATIRKVLPEFKGTKRRIELIGHTESGAFIIDDYAHHPEEIKTTILALRAMYPSKQLVCVFQPHTYSRTKALLRDFASAFLQTKEVILLPIFASAREQVPEDENLNDQLLSSLREVQSAVNFFETHENVVKYVQNHHKGPQNIILTLGAGDVYRVAERLKHV